MRSRGRRAVRARTRRAIMAEKCAASVRRCPTHSRDGYAAHALWAHANIGVYVRTFVLRRSGVAGRTAGTAMPRTRCGRTRTLALMCRRLYCVGPALPDAQPGRLCHALRVSVNQHSSNHCELRTANYKLQTTDYRLQTPTHFPLYAGLRFCANARGPSRASSETSTLRDCSFSNCRPSSTVRLRPR